MKDIDSTNYEIISSENIKLNFTDAIVFVGWTQMKRIIIYFPLLDHFLPTYPETFHLVRVVTRSTIYHIDLDLPSNSHRINRYLCTKHALFQQQQKLYSSSSVFKLQHHCSKPTSKCSSQRKSIFRLDTFVWKKIASNRFSFPPWIWRVHDITSLKHITHKHTHTRTYIT